jgi:hypothetical protein
MCSRYFDWKSSIWLQCFKTQDQPCTLHYKMPKLPGSACFISWNLPPSSFFCQTCTLSGGRGGCEKEYSLYACDNDEKDGRPLRDHVQKKHFTISDNVWNSSDPSEIQTLQFTFSEGGNSRCKWHLLYPLYLYGITWRINISAKKSSRSTPPSTKYQRFNPLRQIAIL